MPSRSKTHGRAPRTRGTAHPAGFTHRRRLGVAGRTRVDTMTAGCTCDCHGRTGHPCSVLGGCGTVGCTEGQVAVRRRCAGDPCADMRPGLCRWHCDRLARELAELPDLVAALEQTWALLPHGGAVGRTGGSDPSLGIRVE